MIVDVFGNIAHPYAAVICHREARPLVGEKVFAKEQGVKECRKSRS
jgi:rRNA processing protein Gar1